MNSITKTFEWSMAHRLIHGYQGKCKNIHGHTYKAEVTIEGEIDPKNYGFVIDFGDVSRTMKEWVNSYLDHAMLVDSRDIEMCCFLHDHSQKHFILPPNYTNSTAENISCLLADVFQDFLTHINPRLKLSEIKVWETPTSCATWRPIL